MKTINYVMAVLIIFFTACSSNLEEHPLLQGNEFVASGKEFAIIHNECLMNIYNSLTSSKTRNSANCGFSKSDIILVANQYIAQHLSDTRAATDSVYISEETFNKTIDDIRNQMSESELNYVERVLSDAESNNLIIEEIINDGNITDSNKKAIICFVTTYEASSEYWQQNIEEWKNNIANTPTTRSVEFNWKEVATADAYWGYTGMLSSGLNLWVGGGAAAVGSAFACLK